MNIHSIQSFLLTPTPQQWIDHAVQQVDMLLLDHAQCEHKAAMNAFNLTYRFQHRPDVMQSLSRIAREEMRHFEQVLAIIKKRQITIRHLPAPRYAKGLHVISKGEKQDELVNRLLIASIIEARSCERFQAIAQVLDDELETFYGKLYQAEYLHYQFFLNLALELDTNSEERLKTLLQTEKKLILSTEKVFRFHSGIPL